MKTLKQVQDLVRSQFINSESIKVVYLGRIANFKHGIVQEAVARYATKSTEFDYPYPQYLHCEFNIIDSDGDSFTVSRDGIEFKKDFYPLPDNFEVGADLFERNIYRRDKNERQQQLRNKVHSDYLRRYISRYFFIRNLLLIKKLVKKWNSKKQVFTTEIWLNF